MPFSRLAEDRVTAAAYALVTTAGAATGSRRSMGISTRHRTRHSVADSSGHLILSLLLSSLVCSLQSPRRIFVEICEAFLTMGNGELNHAEIEIMPYVRTLNKNAKNALPTERRREYDLRQPRQGRES